MYEYDKIYMYVYDDDAKTITKNTYVGIAGKANYNNKCFITEGRLNKDGSIDENDRFIASPNTNVIQAHRINMIDVRQSHNQNLSGTHYVLKVITDTLTQEQVIAYMKQTIDDMVAKKQKEIMDANAKIKEFQNMKDNMEEGCVID